MTRILLISALILDPFQKMQLFKICHKGIDIDLENKSFYTTQYQKVFLKYVGNKHWAKNRQLYIVTPKRIPRNTLFPSTMASGSAQSSIEPYDLSSDDEESLTAKVVAKMTPGWSNCTACLLTATTLYLNSSPESPKNWEQVNLNYNDYHYDPMEIRSTFWKMHIIDRWCQHEEMHSKYTDLSKVTRHIICITQPGVGVDASCSLGQVVICWRQSKTTGQTLGEKVIVR